MHPVEIQPAKSSSMVEIPGRTLQGDEKLVELRMKAMALSHEDVKGQRAGSGDAEPHRVYRSPIFCSNSLQIS